ncbi:MAG: hypothetical protein N3G80_00440 [Candidatus Micrarchaeota archaeon]|nr:hypothetical protein [Candidatus Micrarchaeota archaeon]
MKKSKGQAAMEYLMTYGWALLVIVVVIAILLIINPLQPPTGCRFDSLGFLCSEPLVTSSGKLYLKITNANQNNILIYGMNCTTNRAPSPPSFSPPSSPIRTLQRQEQYEFNITCVDANGVAVTPSAGSDFAAKLWIFYKNQEDGASYPVRSISANIVSKVVSAPGSSTSSPSPTQTS